MDVQHMQWAIVHPGHLLPPLVVFLLLRIVLILIYGNLLGNNGNVGQCCPLVLFTQQTKITTRQTSTY